MSAWDPPCDCPQRLPTAAEAAVDPWTVKRDGDAKKSGGVPRDRARRRHYRCLLTRTEFRHVPLQKVQLIKMLHRSPRLRKAEKEERLAQEFDGSSPHSARGPRSSLGNVQINWQTGGKWPGRLRPLGSAAPS